MEEPRRIVVLGKTGSGKSSTLNTILGQEVFEVCHSSVSGTSRCQALSRRVQGRNLHLIDTPGFFDTDPRSTELSPEILKCNVLCAPGPHAFLILLKVERYTRLEQAVVDVILKYFTDDALRFTTVVFTHGQDLPPGKSILDWANENSSLSVLLQKCEGRCFVLDNRYWNNSQDLDRNNQDLDRNNQDLDRNNQAQVEALLQMIDYTIHQNDGRCYTNDMLKRISCFLQQEAQGIRMNPSKGTTSEEVLNKARDEVYAKMLNNMSGVVIGVLLGALLGVGFMVGVVAVGATVGVKCVAAVAGAAVGGPVGGITGAYVSEYGRPWSKSPEVKAFLDDVAKKLQ